MIGERTQRILPRPARPANGRVARPRRRGEGDGRRVLVVGALVLLAALGTLFVAFKARTGLPGQPFYEISVAMDNLSDLPNRGADVRIAGRRVGQTLDARFEDGRAVVDLQLEPSVRPLPADTRARVRLRGLLGSQYLELVPGRSEEELEEGAVIPAARPATPVRLYDLLDTFDERTQAALRSAVQGLGTAFADRGEELSTLLRDFPAMATDLSRAIDAVRANPGSVTELVRGAESFTAALDPVRDRLAQALADGADALEPFAEEQESLARLIDVAPETLPRIRAGLARADLLLERVTRLARAADRVTDTAPAALAELTTLMREAPQPLGDLRAVLATGRRAVPPANQALRALTPELPRLRRTAAHLREPARVLGAYGCDIRGFARNWRSFLGYAPPGHTGPLGPMTVMRVILGDMYPALDHPRTRYRAYPEPCTALGAEGKPE